MTLKIFFNLVSILLPVLLFIREWKFYDRRTNINHRVSLILLFLMVVSGALSGALIVDEENQRGRQEAQIVGGIINPIVEVDEGALGAGFIIFKITNPSEHPMFDVVVTAKWMDQIANLLSTVESDVRPKIVLPKNEAAWDILNPKSIKVGTVNPRATEEIFRLNTLSTELRSAGSLGGQTWQFMISTRNGGWGFQSITLVPTKSGWGYKASGFTRASQASVTMTYRTSSENYPDKSNWDIPLKRAN